jgi:orotidine-5'-phosphate decarboxylase
MNFQQKLDKICKINNSLLCIGLDPDLEKLPKHILKMSDPFFAFNKAIIDQTHDLVYAYKPNIAFYEAEGFKGLKSLEKTIKYLQKKYPEIPLVLDVKRADIGNTAAKYAKACFEFWDVDAVTVYPYLGLDSVLPFLKYKNKSTILLIKTSNPDSKVFQDLKVENDPFYLKMAKEIKKWQYENISLFVGATHPEELKAVRKLFPDKPFLTAGLGAQGAQTEKCVKAGVDKRGQNLICNSSREIIYAGSDKDFAKKSRKKGIEVKDIINSYRI